MLHLEHGHNTNNPKHHHTVILGILVTWLYCFYVAVKLVSSFNVLFGDTSQLFPNTDVVMAYGMFWHGALFPAVQQHLGTQHTCLFVTSDQFSQIKVLLHFWLKKQMRHKYHVFTPSFLVMVQTVCWGLDNLLWIDIWLMNREKYWRKIWKKKKHPVEILIQNRCISAEQTRANCRVWRSHALLVILYSDINLPSFKTLNYHNTCLRVHFHCKCAANTLLNPLCKCVLSHSEVAAPWTWGLSVVISHISLADSSSLQGKVTSAVQL